MVELASTVTAAKEGRPWNLRPTPAGKASVRRAVAARAGSPRGSVPTVPPCRPHPRRYVPACTAVHGHIGLSVAASTGTCTALVVSDTVSICPSPPSAMQQFPASKSAITGTPPGELYWRMKSAR